MNEGKNRLRLGKKAYIFVILTVLIAVLGTATISHFSSARQIDNFYKSTSISAARTFASLLDAEFLSALRETAGSGEYQAIRERAEADDNESLVEEYLKNKGLWEKYSDTSKLLNRYLREADVVKYLYLLVAGANGSEANMYLMDDDDNPIYITGTTSYNESEFERVDTSGEIEPTISNGEWGWLCSAYAPVYAEDGSIICHVGCYVSMDEVMNERFSFFLTAIIAALVFTVIVQIIAMVLVNRFVVSPLNSITNEMKQFRPAEDVSYDEAGVIQLDINSNDEIQDIYQGIRKMQTEIIDFLNDIREKDEKIGEISKEAYRDALTGVGSKASYDNTVSELNMKIKERSAEFAVVMIDLNDLKKINDAHGHKAGDTYIRGCTRMICDVFKHSPVFRIGGDEFVVLLEGVDYTERTQNVAKIREGFNRSAARIEKQPWMRYSAAVGMSEFTPGDNSYELVFKRADSAMYREKQSLKNKYVSYR